MANMQWPGRIGRNEFDVYSPARSAVRVAELLSFAKDCLHHIRQNSFVQPKIYETGSSNLGTRNTGRGDVHSGHDVFGQLSWLPVQFLGELERQVCGKVSVGGIARTLQGDFCVMCTECRSNPLQFRAEPVGPRSQESSPVFGLSFFLSDFSLTSGLGDSESFFSPDRL